MCVAVVADRENTHSVENREHEYKERHEGLACVQDHVALKDFRNQLAEEEPAWLELPLILSA